jgi:hypothetical protein
MSQMRAIDRLATKVRRAKLSLRPPVSRALLEQFEAEAAVRIPEDYRNFLLEIANGGTAPCRLVPLSWWDASYWLDDTKPIMAELPCVVTPYASEHGADWLNRTNVPGWEQRWDRGEWSPMFGTIAIAEIGCGLFFSMINDWSVARPHLFMGRRCVGSTSILRGGQLRGMV